MLATEQSGRVKGVILTTSGDPGSGYHFVSRYFAPWNGIPEDPVTGTSLDNVQKTKSRKMSYLNGLFYQKEI